MKELSTEEKAQAYDEALERAKEQLDGAKVFDYMEGQIAHDIRTTTYAIFPELKESDDEKIRKAQLDYWRSVGGKEWHGVHVQETIAWLEKQGNEKKYTFKAIPRLLEMVEPTSKAKAYCQKLVDTLVKEGYATDAKIVGECLKQMNGEKVALATMDEKQASKPKWNDDDEQYLLVCKNALRKYQVSDKWDAEIISKWLEDKLKQGEQKPKWTEEDSLMKENNNLRHECL